MVVSPRFEFDRDVDLLFASRSWNDSTGSPCGAHFRQQVVFGNEVTEAGELFIFEDSSTSDHVILEGDWSRVNDVGRGFSRGEMTVRSSVGDRAGCQMSGGVLKIHSNAGNFSGQGMTGGNVEILGSSGDYTAAALPGFRHGMNRGSILIHGNSGDHCGSRMRRGLLFVGGDCGSSAGTTMFGGNLVIGGRIGPGLAWGLRRGTVLLLQRRTTDGDQDKRIGRFPGAWVNLLLKHVAGLMARQFAPLNHEFETWRIGLASPKGELIMPAPTQ